MSVSKIMSDPLASVTGVPTGDPAPHLAYSQLSYDPVHCASSFALPPLSLRLSRPFPRSLMPPSQSLRLTLAPLSVLLCVQIFGLCALQWAAKEGHMGVCAVLLDRGAEDTPNRVRFEGVTALGVREGLRVVRGCGEFRTPWLAA